MLALRHRSSNRWQPWAAGAIGFAGLLLLYVALIGLVSRSLGHALELLWTDRWLVLPLATGFAVQVGLYTYVRRGLHLAHGIGQATALTASGTGTSTVAMIACCAHHVSDVLPLIGLSGAAIFLTQYKVPFMLVGIGSNVLGILVMLRLIRRVREKNLPFPEITKETVSCHLSQGS